MFVSVSTWSQAGESGACTPKNRLLLTRLIYNDLHLNILAPGIFLKFPMEMKKFGFTEIKLFPFHRILKNGWHGGGSSEPPESPLDPPLLIETSMYMYASADTFWLHHT